MPPDSARSVNVLTVDVEEYYHGVEFTEALGGDGLARLPSRVVDQTERLLDLLERYRARATFFTLGIVAQRHPRLVRTIVERGHEIASHGWDHTLLPALGPERFRRDVRAAKRALEQASGHAVWGYRAPNYSLRRDTPWALPTLYEEGYAYDSSVHPIAHDRYGFPDAPRFPHVALESDGVDFWEVPVGTARFAGVNLPLGGGFFRLFPLALLRAAIASVNRREGRPAVLYVHPWELDPDQPRLPMKRIHRFRHYVGLERTEVKLAALLSEFTFTPVAAAFGQIRPSPSALAPSAAS
ncbi:MAG TPA: XrtA system polysaccharide deacetylase [Methylomirabilota bacterium]|nr:XrtA system polysaccharide deacetylase [Methylomirabilota bacterium]